MTETKTVSVTEQIARLEAERDKWHRRATDGAYMAQAYRNMLGPKGLEVAAMWDAKNVQRVHHDWQPAAWKVTGEERAAMILEWESAPKQEMFPGDVDGRLSPAKPEPRAAAKS